MVANSASRFTESAHISWLSRLQSIHESITQHLLSACFVPSTLMSVGYAAVEETD